MLSLAPTIDADPGRGQVCALIALPERLAPAPSEMTTNGNVLPVCSNEPAKWGRTGYMGDPDIRDAMPEHFHRRSIRLHGYDHTHAGAYYLTIRTHERLHLFGQVADGVMRPSPCSDIVQRYWDAIPEHMPHADVGAFVVMPVRCISDHVHGVVVIRERLALHPMAGDATDDGGVGADHDRRLPHPRPPADPGPLTRTMPVVPHGSLGRIVRAFKPACRPAGRPIIRDDGEWERIARYIEMNPANWGNDRFNR